jgi:hypothetical protein
VVGRTGIAGLDLVHRPPEEAAADAARAQARIVAELAECVRTRTPHPLDVHRGVGLQRLIDEAAAQLRG